MPSLEQRLSQIGREPEWSPPTVLRPIEDREAIEKLLDSERVSYVADSLDVLTETMGQMGLLSREQSPEERTRWVYFPWDRHLVRYPDQAAHLRIRTYRNEPVVRRREQDALYSKRGAYIGLSVGGEILGQNVQSGIGRAYLMADYDRLDPTNSNRMRAHMGDVGSSKVSIRAKQISKVDPFIHQVHLPEGFTKADGIRALDAFRPDYIVEAVDDIAVKAMLREYAAKNHIPLLMATDLGEKAPVDVERYDLDPETPPFNGKLKASLIEKLCAGAELSDKKKTRALISLSGGLANIPPRVVEAAHGMREGTLGGIPQLGSTVTRAAADADLLLRDILLGRNVPSGVYRYDPRREFGLERPDPPREVIRIYTNFLRSQLKPRKA